MTGDLSADIVVIGSGPGGAVAATLFAEAGKSVLMLEEGEDLPLDSAAHFSREEILQKYRTGGIGVAFGRDKVAYVEGRCVGGGSEINRGLYHRTPEHVLERWRRDFAVDDLTTDGLAPHFAECEATARVEYLPGAAPQLSQRLGDGAATLGWQAIEAPRLVCYDGIGKPGRKQSMSETFVPRFAQASGRLLANTRARRLQRSASKWRIAARHGPAGAVRDVEIVADTVFVACGAVQTPALLRRSGLRHNIGNSLRLHPMLKVVAEFPDEINGRGDLDPVHQIKQFEPEIGMGCSISQPPMLGLALAAHPEAAARISQEWRRMGIYYVQTTGGRGTVRNLPFFDDAFTTFGQTPREAVRFWKGLAKLVEALFAAGAVAVYPAIPGVPALRSPADLYLYGQPDRLGDGSMTSVHVFSSCPMGENRAVCATDSHGRVHDVDGLYISDASLLCGPTSVNPQGTVMAVSHRNAVHALASRFR